MPAETALRFPYMVWAHEESFVSPYCLAQSGMPAPDAAFLAGVPSGDLQHPCAGAQPAFERALAELFGVDPRRVIATVGASSGMLLCALRWLRAGARVVTERPSYEPFRSLPAHLGADVAVVDRRLSDGWRLDPDAVREAARGGSPAHVFVCNPHNPTGRLEEEGLVLELAAIAADAGGVLVSNESYMEFAPPHRRVHAFALAPNAVSIGTLTKAYGLGPLRVGWIVLGEGLAAERAALTDMAYLAYVDPPTHSLQAGLAALEHLPTLIAPYKRFEVESRPHLLRWLATSPGVEGLPPDIGLACFPRVTGVEDTRAFQQWLARERGVDVVPGEYFGCPGHLRVGFGVPEATLAEGLSRLSRGLADWRARD